MINLSYKVINSESFNQALSYLAQQQGFSNFQAAYNVARIVRQFKKEVTTAREIYQKWADEYFVKNEKSGYETAENPSAICPFKIKDGKEQEFEQKMADFLKTEVEIKSSLLSPGDMGGVKLSPQQILALEPILDSSFFEEKESSSH